jgi:hypothetical protein
MPSKRLIIVFSLWAARISALLLFLLWGAFFVEHLQEWFLRSDGQRPPQQVWIAQVLHWVMLVGLALVAFYPKAGAMITVAGTVLFFSWIGFKEFPYIALLNLIPVILVGIHSAIKNVLASKPS